MSDLKDASQIYPNIEPTGPTVNQIARVSFCSGEQFDLPIALIAKYPKIQTMVPTQRLGSRFKKYVLPILLGHDLTGTFFDSPEEIDEFLSETSYYGIKLDDHQLWNLFSSSGLIEKLIEIECYLERKTMKKSGHLKFTVQERVNEFCSIWKSYIDAAVQNGLYVMSESGESFSFIQASTILQCIQQKNIKAVLRLNYNQKNVIHRFCKYFSEYVIKKDKKSVSQLSMEIGAALGSAAGAFVSVASML